MTTQDKGMPGEPAAPDAEARAVALKFPDTMRQVLEFFATKAAPKEKKVIARTILQGAKAVKQGLRDDRGAEKDESKKKKKGPDPEQVAAALYDILAENPQGKVGGDPRAGKMTRIKGTFDLNEVARELVALG